MEVRWTIDGKQITAMSRQELIKAISALLEERQRMRNTVRKVAETSRRIKNDNMTRRW
jgi:hypothetical protein